MTAIDKVQYLQIGVQGENAAMNVELDMTAWAEQYPDATFHILFKPYNEPEVSPQTSTYDSSTHVLTWTVGAGATAIVGVGYTEIRAQDGGNLIKKTRIIPTAVENSVSGVEVNPPAAYADWVANVLNAGAAAVALSHGTEISFSISDDGHLVYSYTDDDEETVTVDLGPVDAYAMAVAKGYEGTKEEFEQYMADVADAAADAKASAEEAEICKNYAQTFVGAPRTAATADDMTDENLIYVFTGTTTASLTNGHWYFYDGEEWSDGGVYNSTALTTDTTLTVSGAAADAKVAGDKLTELKSALGIEFLPFTANYYIDTNKTEGTVVDYTGEDLHTITGRNCSVYSCKEGDPFTIFGSGGNAARLWAFIDSNSKLISKSVGNLAAPDDGLVIYAPQNASKIIINTTQTAYKGISVEKLSNLINLVVTEENVWENVDTTPTRIENYRINTSGKNYADSNGSIVYLTPSEAGRYKVTSNRTSSTYCFLYNIASVSSVADFVAANVSGSRITITTGTAEINVALGQTIAMSSNSKTFTFTTKKLTTVNEFNQSIGLTETMTDEVNEMISDKDQAAYGLSTDATEYVSRVPSYYITPETTPASFSDAYGYLDNKIAQIPKGGKSFIFVTDTHWDGNEKHSPDLISYIRKRTGIQKVLFGGDIFGNATNKYLAAKKAGDYMNRMKRGAGYDFIPCVGDHDNNTVSVASDDTHFLPYTQVEELFVGDLERYSGYHFYDPSEKLADYATPGSDDYNGAMAFFHTVYYTDDVSKKVRYISLNCGNGGNYGPMYNIFGASGTSLLRLQLDWLVETLLSTPTGYDIVVLSHKGNTGYGGAAAEIINAILWGFRLKQSNFSRSPASDTEAIESWRPHSISYNFSSANDVGLIIALNGHSHRDQLGYTGTTNGTYTNEINYVSSGETIIQPLNPTSSQNVQIPLIITSCDSLGAAESQSPSMTAGTVTEQCFDVITILDDKIKMTRIGAGDDRVLYITKTNPES